MPTEVRNTNWPVGPSRTDLPKRRSIPDNLNPSFFFQNLILNIKKTALTNCFNGGE